MIFRCSLYLLVFFLLGCASQSIYRGGSGNFRDFEGYSEWKSTLMTNNFVLQNPKNYVNSFEGGNIPADLFQKDSSMMIGMRESAAIQMATMRPYKINGKWYHPSRVDIGDIFDGIASWYGPNFHDKKTSNGETYNMHAHTAASKTLPMNTIVRVTNKENGKVTIVRINDRGPFVDGRIIDLSNVAARDIAMVDKGTARVRVEVIGFGGVIARSYERKLKSVNQNQRKLISEFGIGDTLESVEGGGFMIQVGAYKSEEGAKSIQSEYSSRIEQGYKMDIRKDDGIYRVFIKGFRSEDEAEDFGLRIGIADPITVRE